MIQAGDRPHDALVRLEGHDQSVVRPQHGQHLLGAHRVAQILEQHRLRALDNLAVVAESHLEAERPVGLLRHADSRLGGECRATSWRKRRQERADVSRAYAATTSSVLCRLKLVEIALPAS
jgi:hypothetical protein